MNVNDVIICMQVPIGAAAAAGAVADAILCVICRYIGLVSVIAPIYGNYWQVIRRFIMQKDLNCPCDNLKQ